MLKTRVIPLILFSGYSSIKSINFTNFRKIGSLVTTCRIYAARGVDELILLDINASSECRNPDFSVIEEIASELFMPITFGGGIKTLEHAGYALRTGADKVSINSAALSNPKLISDIAKKFGSQACVVSIDVKKIRNQSFIYSNNKVCDFMSLASWVKEVEDRGAGEILLNSVNNDGLMTGYDIELIKYLTEIVKIPIIAAGGGGAVEHFTEAILNGGAQAVAAGSVFHFTNLTPKDIKKYMEQSGIPVRLD